MARNKFLSKELEILKETLGRLPTKLSMVNLHTLLFCRLQVVPSVVRLMKQANVFPLKKTLKKFIIWEKSTATRVYSRRILRLPAGSL